MSTSYPLPDRGHQGFLCHILLLKGCHHVFIDRILHDDVLDHDGTLLALPIKPPITLLVELQGPNRGKPDEMAATGLEIEAMSGTGRVNQGYRDLSRIPSPDIL